jgi:hypothetical protein
MEYSIAHRDGMNLVGQDMFPNGRVPWRDSEPPDLGNENHTTGRLRSCAYCGSMHPADVAAAIRAGARGEWADMKYGWPHKAYFTGIPNPHAGMLEARAFANYQPEGKTDWVKVGKFWREPGTPAEATTYGKFYSVHLMDATAEDRAVIESHLGLAFHFIDDGKVSWRPVSTSSAQE